MTITLFEALGVPEVPWEVKPEDDVLIAGSSIVQDVAVLIDVPTWASCVNGLAITLRKDPRFEGKVETELNRAMKITPRCDCGWVLWEGLPPSCAKDGPIRPCRRCRKVWYPQ